MRLSFVFCWLLMVASLPAQEGYWGAIDTTGTTVIPFIYDGLNTPSHGLIVARKDGYSGVLNAQGEIVVPFSPAHISSYENGTARYTMSSVGCGYLDSLGQLTVPVAYDRCEPFYDSLAWVAKTIDGKLRYGVINRAGEQVVPFRYDRPGEHISMDGFYKVMRHGKFGLIDRTGKVIAEPIYQRMGLFSEGKLQAMKNGLYGFIDQTGAEVIPFIYPWAGYYMNGQSYTRNGSNVHFLNHQGDTVFDATGLHLSSVFDQDGLASVEKNNQVGYMNRQGEMVVPLHYRIIDPPRHGLRRVVLNDWNGMVNEEWEVVIPIEYESVRADAEGVIFVTKNGKSGMINEQLEVLIPFEFDYIEGFGNEQDFTLAKRGRHFGVIDKTGQVLIPFEYKRVPALGFPFGLCPFNKDDKMGFLNLRGETIIPFEYQRARPFTKEGIAICQKPG